MTLLEMLIVMAILTVIISAIAFGIDKALVNQRFRNEVSQIVDELRRAQDMMMILDADVHVKFAELEQNKGINYWVEMETQISDSLQKEIVKKIRTLKTIRGIFFRDPLNEAEGLVDLRFLSKGAVMSKGLLRLSISGLDDPPANTLQTYICLPGYPRPIVAIDDKEEAEIGCNDQNDSTFDEALTRDTFERLPEEVKKPSAETPEVPQEEKKGQQNETKENQPPKSPPARKELS